MSAHPTLVPLGRQRRRAVAAAQRILVDAIAAADTPCVTTGFQRGGVVLLHLIKTAGLNVPVLLIDSGYLPESTAIFGGELCDAWALDLHVVAAGSVAEFEAANGGPLHTSDPDRCCAARKVEPGHRALAGHDLWITAVRRGQSSERSDVSPSAQVALSDGATITRVAPLVSWTWADLEAYSVEHELPMHPLYAAGYTSIGCAPCSSPTWAEGDVRTGRWNGAKTECGLQLVPEIG